jgi:prepilin-type N-terminal cleavage/methylation domain-containing protein
MVRDMRNWDVRREHGFTLIETMVAVSLLTAVIVAFGPVMTSSFRAGEVLSNESRAIDEIRVAVARIDRELRSACVVTTPTENTAGSSLTFTTKTDSGGDYDVTYAVQDGQLTRTRGTGVTTVGDGLVVTTREFEHVRSNTGTRREIRISLQVQFNNSGSPRLIETTIAGRNTWFGC